MDSRSTSYHYFAPARELAPSPAVVTAIRDVLDEKGIAYRTGKTWTTDALYRETPGKVARRRAEGCLTVEMECSALCGVARFRDVTFGQILYGGDDVSGLEWTTGAGTGSTRFGRGCCTSRRKHACASGIDRRIRGMALPGNYNRCGERRMTRPGERPCIGIVGFAPGSALRRTTCTAL